MNFSAATRILPKNQLVSFVKGTAYVGELRPWRPVLSHACALPMSHALDRRLVSTEAFQFMNNRDGSQTAVQKIKMYFRKHKLRAAGFKLYEAIADRLEYSSFMSKLNMPDTFHSWFLVTELHTWMLMARLMANPHEGRLLRNYVVEALWKDVSTRAKKLGDEHSSVVKNQIFELNEGFQAALVLYDEGLLSNDKVLASALWRRFYSQNCNSARDLEALVSYVRRSMHTLDSIELEDLVYRPMSIQWTPIDKVFQDLGRK